MGYESQNESGVTAMDESRALNAARCNNSVAQVA